MAIYHFSGTLISRSQGRSAVACAAYRSGERLMDERYEKVQDFTHKQDVVHKEILLPENAPAWMSDREKLWNLVEAFERRKDAQLAREFNFSLPKELNHEQNLELARDFVQTQFVDRGMVADMCIHLDKNDQGEHLPHVHVMLTLREIVDDGFGQKVRAWNDKLLLANWREAWAETANKHLALNDLDLKIDHRSLAAQDINLEPQYKVGPVAARPRLARLEDHQRIARENGERLLANPEIALKGLTQQQSTFTHQDIARFVNRHTVDKEQFEQVYQTVKACDGLVKLGLDEQNRERFTTNEMLKLETQMLAQASALANTHEHGLSEQGRLNANLQALSPEQRSAFEFLTQSNDLACVVGYAGSGKSTLLGAAREAWEGSGYRVHGVTLSGIAAEGLQGASGIESRTLASRSYYWDKGEQRLGSRDILVVDEAGMLGSRQMARIFEEASNGGAKVVLVGDPQQLQAIQAGGAFRAIVERGTFVELTHIHRQQESWQREATREFAQGRVNDALTRYEHHQHIHAFQTEVSAKAGLIELWNDARLSEPDKSQIILAYTRADVKALNESARECRQQLGELGQAYQVQTERGEREFAVGERLYFLKNDRSLGVMNGTLGTLESIEGQACRVRLDGDKGEPGRLVSVDLRQYNHLEYGYAATIHKAQGVTVDRSYLLGSKYMDAHAAYVGMSRHRLSVDVCYSTETFLKFSDLVETFERDRSKAVSLDYLDQGQTIMGPEIMIETRDNALDSFQSQFEAAYPGRAKALQETLDGGLLKGSAERQSHLEKGTDDFSDFKKQFEANNPERAQELSDRLRPSHEQEALKLEEKFMAFEKDENQVELFSELKEDIMALSENREAQDFLRDHNPEVAQRIEAIQTQEVEKTLELSRDDSKGLEIDF